MHENQSAMLLNNEQRPSVDWLQLHHVIIDRGSRYSVTLARVHQQSEVKGIIERLVQNKRYKKATHNSFAYRLAGEGRVVDGKQDDGETGAGMAILRVLHRNNLVNVVVIVTRWFGGVKLHGDRFKHIVDATQEVITAMKNKTAH